MSITCYGNKQNAENFIKSLEKKRFTFSLVTSYTETCEIPGITIAGADKEFLKFTSPADAEYLSYGECKCIDSIPMSPDGKPTPALLTRVALKTAKIPHFIINAGSKISPNVSSFDSELPIGKNISESSALTQQEVHDAVNRLIPAEAMVRNTWLDPALSEVILECDDPSSAVGPKGSHVNSLRDEIGWLVKIERAPARESRTQHDIRRYRKELADDRKSLLKKFGTRIYRPQRPGEPWVRVSALGSYREVGRAMHLVTTNESKVLVDVGAKPTNKIFPF